MPQVTDSRRSPGAILREGARVGLVGAAAVAVWFLVVDVASGTPLRTPAALGSVIFLGASGPDQILINPVTVGLYTVLHGVAFMLIGTMLAAAASAAERTPTVLAGALLLMVAFEAFFVGAVAIVAQFLLGELAWWGVLGGNVTAALAMGSVLFQAHPEAVRRLATTEALPEVG